MSFSADQENDGVKFELEADGELYSGTITIEALQDHFTFSSQEVVKAAQFCVQYAEEVSEQIRTALRRHPPLFGREHILLLPHHFR